MAAKAQWIELWLWVHPIGLETDGKFPIFRLNFDQVFWAWAAEAKILDWLPRPLGLKIRVLTYKMNDFLNIRVYLLVLGTPIAKTINLMAS